MSTATHIATVPLTVFPEYIPDRIDNKTLEVKPMKEFVQDGPSGITGTSVFSQAVDAISWFEYLLSSLSHWLYTQPVQPNPALEEELWKDWEWVLSKTEEFTIRQSQEEGERIKLELTNLKNSAKLYQFRNYFYSKVVRPAFVQIRENQQDAEDLSAPLDASKVYKIISDIVRASETEWLEAIKKIFFTKNNQEKWWLYFEDFREKPYQRNVVGSLKELAFSAAYGAKNGGINERVLADTLWSFWKALTETVRVVIGDDIDHSQLQQLAEVIAQVRDTFLNLWIDTVRKSKMGRIREGHLVEKWRLEQEEEELRISKIKARGTDARWSHTIYNAKHALNESELDIKNLRKFLESNLLFSQPKKH